MRTTSTSFMVCTGLKKCRPSTRSGRAVAAAIRVTESAVVPVASTVLSGQIRSSSAKTSRFSSSCSGTSSITRSAAAAAVSSWPTEISASSAVRSSAVIRSRSTACAVASSIRASARAAESSVASMPITRRPLLATATATPAPIVPRPTTATVGKGRSMVLTPSHESPRVLRRAGRRARTTGAAAAGGGSTRGGWGDDGFRRTGQRPVRSGRTAGVPWYSGARR